jgi:RNA polymerase sigma factor (TIGR02999 family)
MIWYDAPTQMKGFDSVSDVTKILGAMEQGDRQAAAELLPLVYEELRKLAAAKMASENPGQTLQPTALVHEAWLRLVGDANRKWNDRTHFFAAAAEAMRRILVDNARRKRAQRHGGGQQRLELLDLAAPSAPNDDQLLAVNDALDKFAALDPQKAELVKLRYFVGMTIEETSEALGISKATAKRHWDYAKAWLYEEIRAQQK